MIDDSKLVERLVRSDAISKKDLRRGLDLAKKSDKSLYETLAVAELLDERALVKTAGKMLNVRPVWLGERTPNSDVTDRVPSSLAVRNKVLPLKFESDGGKERLVLAMFDPLDVLAMDEIASHTGVDVRPVLAGPGDLARALERVYGVNPNKESQDAARLDAIEQAASGEADPSDDALDVALDGEVDDHGLNDDSWAAFFDEAEDVDYTEDSAVISRDMQDRAISSILDAVDPDAEDDAGDEDSLKSLDEPLSKSQITGGIEPDLADWEVDGALDGQDAKDYAKIGQLFVYSPEKAAAESEAEIVEEGGETKRQEGRKEKSKKEQEEGSAGSDDSLDDTNRTDSGRTAFGFGPASLLADEESEQSEPSAEPSSVQEESEANVPLEETFVARLAELADLDEASQRQIEGASPDELIYATVLALAQSGALDARVLLEYIPPRHDDESDVD